LGGAGRGLRGVVGLDKLGFHLFPGPRFRFLLPAGGHRRRGRCAMTPHQFDNISDRVDRFLLLIGQHNRKFIFDTHHQLKAIKTRYAEIMDQMGIRGYLTIVKQKRFL
jgi:hypothetical protein